MFYIVPELLVIKSDASPSLSRQDTGFYIKRDGLVPVSGHDYDFVR